MRLRLLAAFAVASFGSSAFVIACSDETTSSSPSARDGSTDGRTGSGYDSAEEEEDGATNGSDAGKKDATPDAKPARDANGPGEAGAECSFNHDCQLALRCECDGLCECKPGARGTGRNGIDACDAGEQCASSLCVEGPGDSGVHYCSDECASNVDCTGMLPKCTVISFIGQICVRDGG